MYMCTQCAYALRISSQILLRGDVTSTCRFKTCTARLRILGRCNARPRNVILNCCMSHQSVTRPRCRLSQDKVADMLTYALKVCMSLIQQRTFRNKVLRVLVELYLGLAAPDYISVCQVNASVSTFTAACSRYM